MFRRILFTLLVASLPALPQMMMGEVSEGYVSLFNGRDLDGWSGDPRVWKVDGGMIVGSTEGIEPLKTNTFLIYEKEKFQDFILRAQVRLRNHNTGIQFRSDALPNWKVTGLQADAAADNWWGSIYDEGGTRNTIVNGWKGKAEKVVKTGDWNDYEIEARGGDIRIRVNGLVTAELSGEIPRSGVIALQVHAGPPMLVEFRSIRIKKLDPPKTAVSNTPFAPLFDGATLAGWQQCNGTATYRAENGVIVGRTAEGSPNSFLCTTKNYGDFVLEFETMTDPKLNSGVQIRSHKYPEARTVRTFNGKEITEQKQSRDRVYGYQVEVANEQSGASGGVYDEARRGWLALLNTDPLCSKAFVDNKWNRYRVEAIGDRIRTWVNGIPCADFRDATDLSGFIALQVHQYKGDQPAEVKWRNLRIRDLGRHEWTPLFDGKTLAGWTQSGGGTWTVENGAIHAVSKDGDERIGFVITDRAMNDATVRVKFKIAKGNSGFFVRSQPPSMKGYEVEIDEAKGTGGFWEVGGRRWVTGPEDNAGVFKDDWSELVASLHGRRITFFLNGMKTVDLPNDEQGVTLDGRIALQAHGSKRRTEVWFKDIGILEKVQ